MDRVLTKEFLERELTLEEADYFEEKIFKPALASSCLQHKIDAWTVWSLLNEAEKRRKEREAIGLEKGRAEGLEKGRKELREEREKMVINSHRAGVSVETIAAFTGLTAEQIAEILKRRS